MGRENRKRAYVKQGKRRRRVGVGQPTLRGLERPGPHPAGVSL